MNQCDGCRRGMPLKNGIHKMPGSTFWDGDAMSCTKDRYEPKYVIAETATSTWSYHLREVADGVSYYFTGGAPDAVCGAKLGWDTRMPLSAWGLVDHMPSKWCTKCGEVAGLKP